VLSSFQTLGIRTNRQMRLSLESALLQARTIAPDELPRFLGDLEEVRVTALARLSIPTIRPQPDELLTVEETSKRMGISTDYLYRNHRRLPFVRRVGRRLLFSSAGLDSYITKKR
jgi:excisionase family DNA binding protein